MEIKDARITILVGEGSTTIEIKDANAGVTFAKVTLTPEQLCAALSRLSYTECKAEVFGLDKLGKKMETDKLVFAIPENIDRNDKTLLHEQAIKTAPQGWTPEKYYGSQDSFFEKGNKKYARVTIRRWI